MKPTTTVLQSIKIINGEDLMLPHEPAFGSSKILLIGCDEELTIKLLAGNFKLTYAANIHEARKIIQNALGKEMLFDAVICDAGIEEKTILHFARYLSATETINQVPFILFAKTNKVNSDLCTQGINDFINSETSLQDLSDKIILLKKYKVLESQILHTPCDEEKSGFNAQHFLKRMVDIMFSSVALLLLSPLIIIIAICIKFESKGPIFYRSLRAGTGYKVFTFFKFRTMVANAEDMVKDLKHLNEYKDYQGSYFFKIKDDPRVTRVGHFLRKTSLDELPQLINVLKGDMSLVGNRPLPLYEASSITIDKSAKRFLAPAGITGLWQVKGRSNLNLSVDERISMDIDYAEKQSFLFDMKILLKTPKELILKNNV